MSISPTLTKFCFLDKKKTFTQSLTVETKTEILTEEIKKILNLTAVTAVSSSTTQKDGVKGSGRIVFYVCYENVQGKIVKSETPADYEFFIPVDLTDAKLITTLVKSDKVEADVSGIKLELKSVVTASAVVRKNSECLALTDGENLVCRSSEVSLKRGLGVKKIIYPIEQEFELPYAIDEVMFHRANPVVTCCQCGVGTIIVDGEVRLCAILLQKDEKKIIIKEEKKIPFRAEIEYDEAMPALSALARVDLKSFKTDITVDSEQNKSLVTASVILNLEGEATENQTLNLATDVFSLTDETNVERREIAFLDSQELRSVSTLATLSVALNDSQEQPKTLKAMGGEKVEIVSTAVIDDKLSIAGVVSFTGFFDSEENSVSTRKFESPFECLVDASLVEGSAVEVIALAECKNFSLTSEGLDVECNLTFTIYPEIECKCSVIGNIESVGEKSIENSAISVYIPESGEDLWGLSKKLNQTPEQITATNKDLTFPLTGSERIVIYRQK